MFESLYTLVSDFISMIFDSIILYGLKCLRTLAGVQVKYLSRKGGEGLWCYTVRKAHQENDHPTFVFLHGFGSDKDLWSRMIGNMPKQYDCVALDMPGHGETTFVDGLDELNFDSYIKSIKEFLELSGLEKKPIYLIGTSFGGAVAGVFAHYYPENVSKLGLLCPAVKTPVLTNTLKRLINGEYGILIPTNGTEIIQMIKSLSNRRMFYPVPIMDSFVKLNYPECRRSRLKGLLESIVANEFLNFEASFERLCTIKADTLIIWGKDDEIIDVSGAKMLNDGVKNSKLVVLDDCNHIIPIDKPIETVRLLVSFLD